MKHGQQQREVRRRDGAAAAPMFGSTPMRTGRMYSDPGGSGTRSRWLPTTARIIPSSSSTGGGGRCSSSALTRIRAAWASARNSLMGPSTPRCAFKPSKQALA